MKSSVAKLYAAAGGVASILAYSGSADAFECFNYETDYFGSDLQKIFEGPATESPAQCQEACQRHDLCAHWTYIADRKQCYLKDANAPRGAVPNPLATSGPRVCFHPDSCFEHGTDYYGRDMEKVEDGSIHTPMACQQLCRDKEGCAYWTFVRDKKNCYLKGSLEAHDRVPNTEAVSGPKVCSAESGQDCYERDTDYVGYDLEEVGDSRATSPEDCQALCDASSRCHFWTWLSSLRNCYLKNNQARAGRTHVPGCISGPRKCVQVSPSPAPPQRPEPAPIPEPAPPTKPLPPAKSCHDHGTMYKGGDIESRIYVATVEDCQRHCQQHPECLYFTYFTHEKRCALKRAQGQSVPHDHAISGGKFCSRPPVSKCLKTDVEIFGRDIDIAAAASPQDCEQLCNRNVLCASYTYKKDTKLCIQRQHEGTALGVMSGKKSPRPEDGTNQGQNPAPTKDCFSLDFAYSGPGVGIQEHIASPEECQQTCQGDFLCWAFTYSIRERKCLLQGWAGDKVSQLGMVSGRKHCASTVTPPVREGCLLGDYELYGREFSSPAADSAQACQKICQENSLCSFWAHSVESGTCSLRQREAFSVRTASGYKHCWLE